MHMFILWPKQLPWSNTLYDVVHIYYYYINVKARYKIRTRLLWWEFNFIFWLRSVLTTDVSQECRMKKCLHYNFSSQDSLSLILKTNTYHFSVTAFNQRFDQFYYEQNDPNVLVQNFPAYLDPYYSTYRSLGGANFNFMKVHWLWIMPCFSVRISSGLGMDFPSQWRLQHGRWHPEQPGLPEESCLWDLEVSPEPTGYHLMNW